MYILTFTSENSMHDLKNYSESQFYNNIEDFIRVLYPKLSLGTKGEVGASKVLSCTLIFWIE